MRTILNLFHVFWAEAYANDAEAKRKHWLAQPEGSATGDVAYKLYRGMLVRAMHHAKLVR